MSQSPRFATRAARAAPHPPSASRPLTPPIHLANVYVFDDLAQVDAVWEGQRPGYIYGRFGTPNHTMLEATLAGLEGSEDALVTASGMGALTALFLAALRPGDHLVAGQDLYGSTTALLREQAPRWGIAVSFADAAEVGAVEAALTPATRAVFVEAVSNPLLRLADLPGLAEVSRRRGLALLVDGTFASPALLRPLEHGATAVHHSATKYLSGHGDATAGVLAGDRGLIAAARAQAVRIGLNLGPFDAWLVLRGVRTLALRMERHSANALAVARFLASRPEVRRVHYPGLPDHPQHGLATKLLTGGFGGMLAFELRGGAAAVERFFATLTLIEFAPSFGDLATTWSYPARTSHRPLSAEDQAKLGIDPGLVRLSVGIEDVDDLREALDAALTGAGT
ncbi:MAG TPA: aminotransferase class I/II-fold pyridoxal phosphate-dependent enzyme [Methylomirabilota bacterium]|jgi:cystathionine gamma-synthase|nr:aminotransferase class I/II-fold pyridoxal phosphate-dependent enzyme [Methylomirabilota bacterium]